MLTKRTIVNRPAAEPSLDRRRLFNVGLEHVRALASGSWTDHNVHDPGITILEFLTYALTDLSYRAMFPIEDLLASEHDNRANMHRQFFSARQILPGAPLTVADYRKLVTDLPGVRNAWIEPVNLTYYADPVAARLRCERPDGPGVREVRVMGLYRVLVDFMDGVLESGTGEELKSDVFALLQANRNLCEDFVEVQAIQPQVFNLCGEIELSPEADAARVEAEIRVRVNEYLAPSVRNYTLAEMGARASPGGMPYTVPDIFDGPTLQCGFIDDAELERALRTEIRLSDVISIVMDVEGVVAVRDIIVNSSEEPPPNDRWIVPIGAGRRASLSTTGSRFVFYKGAMPVTPSRHQVASFAEALAEQARTKLEHRLREDVPIPLGRFRGPARYVSFQRHFPAVYGLIGNSVPDGEPARQKLALQLKAYLLFFDQIMANDCAQLSHLGDLFGTDERPKRTYFAQEVEPGEFAALYTEGQETLQRLVEKEDERADRRGRFLDHLLARFAERFNDYAQITHAAFGARPAIIEEAKRAFLKDYPTTSARRGLGEDVSKPGWDSDNISGLERRLARLLGITRFERRTLSQVSLGPDAEVGGSPQQQFDFRLRHRLSHKVIFSSVKRYPTAGEATAALRLALELAQLPSGIRRGVAADGRHFFTIVTPNGEVVARRRGFFTSRSELEQAIDSLMEYVRQHYSREGMYLFENLLLRPPAVGCDDAMLLPICIDQDCADCPNDDPYSYRIHIVLPAEAGRFRDMPFRRFVERVIRDEVPAHILPKVCWIDDGDLVLLERAYRAWVAARADGPPGDRNTTLQALIDVLYRLKNIYPQERLADCDAAEDRPKFLLGQTALGSADVADQPINDPPADGPHG